MNKLEVEYFLQRDGVEATKRAVLSLEGNINTDINPAFPLNYFILEQLFGMEFYGPQWGEWQNGEELVFCIRKVGGVGLSHDYAVTPDTLMQFQLRKVG